MMPRDRGLRTTSDHTPTAYDRLAEAIAEKDAELAALRAELAAMTAERDELRREFRGMVDEAEQRANSIVAQEDAFIKDLCERLGYGAVMDSAARQWYLKNPDGAFVVAGCACVVRRLAAGAKNTDYYTANEADAEAAEERVILMRRDNQRAAAARRVAEYCRGLHAELDGLELERAEIARRVAAYYRQRKPK